MKKQLFSSLLLLMMAVTANAQIVKGDMNDDGIVDISDVVSTVNVVLGTQPISYISANDILDPYMVDNSKLVGTWYKTKTEKVTFGEDGSTDYSDATKYEFMPYQGRVILYDSTNIPIGALNILKATDEYLYIAVMGTSAVSVYTKAFPTYKVSDITLNETSVTLRTGTAQQLTATVSPADADDPSVIWASSDESVVSVTDGLITAIAAGTATITCSANDGSDVIATCTVKVWVDHSGTIDGHDYVDLGLTSGTLWAATNIGANTPEEFGDYFAWGETKGYNSGKTNFVFSTYKYCKGTHKTLTKYCFDSSYGYNGFTDTLSELESSDDAAYINWSSNWCMPSFNQLKELYDECTWTWTVQNNVVGYLVCSKTNSNSIFFPAAGIRKENGLFDTSIYGNYLLSSLGSCPYYALILRFDNENVYWEYGIYRCNGNSVRPVRSK